MARQARNNSPESISLKDIKKARSYKARFQRYRNEKLNWFQIVFRLEGSVIPAILPSVLLAGSYGFLITLLYYTKVSLPFIELVQVIPTASKVLPNVVVSFNIILSVLLVFRTNTAHERFWEGRKLWGALVNTVRNLARDIWIVVEERDPSDRLEKESTLRLLVAFAVAMKLHLRREPVNEKLEALMSSLHYFKLKSTDHPPLEIAF